MSYPITTAQRDHISSLSASERYFHCIDMAAEHGALWTLKKGDELLLFTDDEERMIIPVWPHPDYAGVFATGEWQGVPAVKLDLETFLNHTLPSCIEDDVHFLVFPTSEQEGGVSSAEDLKQELLTAQEQAKEKSAKTLDDIPELSDEILEKL